MRNNESTLPGLTSCKKHATLLPSPGRLVLTGGLPVKLSEEGALEVPTGGCVPPQPVGRREIKVCILKKNIQARKTWSQTVP